VGGGGDCTHTNNRVSQPYLNTGVLRPRCWLGFLTYGWIPLVIGFSPTSCLSLKSNK